LKKAINNYLKTICKNLFGGESLREVELNVYYELELAGMIAPPK
jgi:hypothetical protein